MKPVAPHAAHDRAGVREARPLAPEETEVVVQCPSCSNLILARAGQRLPPWCSKCGTDLKGAQAARPEVVDAAQQEQLAGNLQKRLTRHNIAVGLLLAPWGLFIGLRGQPTSLDKLLSAQPALATLVTVLQWLTLANGGTLLL